MHGTRPGWWHDRLWCCWRFFDGRGKEVAVITDEAYSRDATLRGASRRGPAAVWSGD